MIPKNWMLVAIAAFGVFSLLAAPGFAQPGAGAGWMSGGYAGTGQPLSLAQAEAAAQQAIAQTEIPGLSLMHIMEFSNNFYVAVRDNTTGQGAFELLVDRYTGFVRPEPQSMMWNTKYGHMAAWGGPGTGAMGSGYGSGMMGPGYGGGSGYGGPGYGYGPGMMGPGGNAYGGPGAVQPGGKPLTLAQARVQAQQYLATPAPWHEDR